MPPNIPAAVAWYLLRHSARSLYRRPPSWLSYKRFIPKKRYIAAGTGLAAMPYFAQTKRGRAREIARERRSHKRTYYDSISNGPSKRARVDTAVKSENVQVYRKIKSGRRKSKSSAMMSMMKSVSVPQIHRFQNLTVANDAGGAYNLSYWNSNAAADLGDTALPVYFMDLNHLLANNVGGTMVYDAPFRRLYRKDATAGNVDQFFTQVVFGRDNEDSANVYNWVLEKGYNLTNADRGIRAAYLNWVESRLLIYGARKYPSRVRVSLIRWTDTVTQARATVTATYQNPAPTFIAARSSTPDTGSLYTPATETDTQRDWNAFWLERTASMTSNPLTVRPKGARPLFTVLKSHTYDFQPRSLDTDGPAGGVGEQVVLKWFHEVGKTFKFLHTTTSDQPNADEQSNPNEFPLQTFAELECVCAPRARMSLMIEGITQSTSSADGDPDTAPSFDMCVRRKWTFTAN